MVTYFCATQRQAMVVMASENVLKCIAEVLIYWLKGIKKPFKVSVLKRVFSISSQGLANLVFLSHLRILPSCLAEQKARDFMERCREIENTLFLFCCCLLRQHFTVFADPVNGRYYDRFCIHKNLAHISSVRIIGFSGYECESNTVLYSIRSFSTGPVCPCGGAAQEEKMGRRDSLKTLWSGLTSYADNNKYTLTRGRGTELIATSSADHWKIF